MRDQTGIQKDLKEFRDANKLAHAIVVYVASTEPSIDPEVLPAKWAALEKLLDKPQKCPLPASSAYAIAALDLGFSFINFTPSTGSTPAAISELAIERGARHMGYDGKTGEIADGRASWPRCSLAATLDVMSWVEPQHFWQHGRQGSGRPDEQEIQGTPAARLVAKLPQILGYPPQTLVSIEYIRSMGDWKTAWDHIHFRGFLGTPMTLQFIWQEVHDSRCWPRRWCWISCGSPSAPGDGATSECSRFWRHSSRARWERTSTISRRNSACSKLGPPRRSASRSRRSSWRKRVRRRT